MTKQTLVVFSAVTDKDGQAFMEVSSPSKDEIVRIHLGLQDNSGMIEESIRQSTESLWQAAKGMSGQ